MRRETQGSVGTRDRILRALKMAGGASVLSLADQVDVSPVTVRHHLGSLQADGLVQAKVERRAVGRPRHLYHLTDTGEELFPRMYYSFARRLLDQVSHNLPAETLSSLFDGMAADIISSQERRLRGKTQSERMAILAEILEAEGFMVQLSESEGAFQIFEHNCPYRNLGDRFPDICKLDQAIITAVLEAPARKTSCQLQGDQRCTFVVPKDAPSESDNDD